MGYLKSIGTSIIYIGAFLAAITFIPGLPPRARFAEYSIVTPEKLTDSKNINNRLHNAEILFEGELKGPEAFASYNGEIYTGIHGGYVVKIANNKKIIPVVKFGKECDGMWQEDKCGRPLGLKFDKNGALFVCDAYYGIFKVDVKTGKYQRIININEPIEGKKPMIPNSLDIASNGDIYWSDSSTDFYLYDGFYTILANPSGRLIRYDAATKKNHVLIHDLGFPNGVALSRDEDFVIVAETSASRVVKYNLKGPKTGKREIFIEGLPGLPDNINSDHSNGFFINLIAANGEEPQLFQSLQPHPYIRRMLARFFTLVEAPFKYLQLYYPNYYAEAIIHFIGHFESTRLVASNYVGILRVDSKGKIVDAAYNTDGKLNGVSETYIHNGDLWLGSPYAEYVARIPIKEAFPSLLIEEQKQPEKKKSTANVNAEQKPSSTTQTPKPAESKSSATQKSKPVESKSNSIPTESKSSESRSKTSSNTKQKSSHRDGTNPPKK